jgi:hypothetical protein
MFTQFGECSGTDCKSNGITNNIRRSDTLFTNGDNVSLCNVSHVMTHFLIRVLRDYVYILVLRIHPEDQFISTCMIPNQCLKAETISAGRLRPICSLIELSRHLWPFPITRFVNEFICAK